MRYILIPVKNLGRAKQRLAALMTQEERTRFAWEMLLATFNAAAKARNSDRVAVVTDYEPAIALARDLGMDVIREIAQVSESASVDFGSAELERRGATAVLRLPIDLPLLASADIDALLALETTSPATILVPSRDGTGTNAILREPPTLFPSHFGPGSLALHRSEASSAGAHCQIITSQAISLDIDDPDDVRYFLKESAPSGIRDLLLEMGIDVRLHEA